MYRKYFWLRTFCKIKMKFVILHPESKFKVTDNHGIYSKFILINDNLYELNKNYLYKVVEKQHEYYIYEFVENLFLKQNVTYKNEEYKIIKIDKDKYTLKGVKNNESTVKADFNEIETSNFRINKIMHGYTNTILFDPNSTLIKDNERDFTNNAEMVYKKKDIYNIVRNFKKEKEYFTNNFKNIPFNIYDYYTINSYILFYCEKIHFKTMFFFVTGMFYIIYNL